MHTERLRAKLLSPSSCEPQTTSRGIQNEILLIIMRGLLILFLILPSSFTDNKTFSQRYVVQAYVFTDLQRSRLNGGFKEYSRDLECMWQFR